MSSKPARILVLKKIRYLYKLNEADVKKAAQKIQKAQTFQELHDIMVAYANLGDYKSPNAPEVPRRCPSPRAPVEFDYHDLLPSISNDWDPFDKDQDAFNGVDAAKRLLLSSSLNSSKLG